MMLRKIRIVFATISLIAITALFLDFTGTIHNALGWIAKIQFIPALLALNVGAIVLLVILTFLFGRVYCSVICPLGIFQDVVSRLNGKLTKYKYAPSLMWLRYSVLLAFILFFILGISSVIAFLEPYSAYGRIATTLFAPIYKWGNNLIAYIAERADSYAFYETEVMMIGVETLIVAGVTFVIILVLAWRNGRLYCNAICPVGTILGIFSKFSLFKHRIDIQKCNGCGLCARSCKSQCIDPKNHTIDYTRCVSCFNCIGKCNKKAISYNLRKSKSKKDVEKISVTKVQVDSARRNMLTLTGAVIATSIVKAQGNKVDGGLAFIEDKKIPNRQTQIVPPGAESIRNFNNHCTSCQLCVSACPNQILRPSSNLSTFMQPSISYERGYCRPECVKCSEVCPAGAINPINIADKSATQIGHAVWIEKNCVVLNDGVACGNCARHCPVGAITMIEREQGSVDGKKIPIVNVERCIGCGACEHLCPARPFSAIYVEGHSMHRII